MTSPVRALLFSTLYPSSVRPTHGIFVETRLRELLKTGEVEARVVAPVPWFPFTSRRFGQYAAYAKTPAEEKRGGVAVYHPRYPLLPKVGMSSAPLAMAVACLPVLRRLIRNGFDFDLIDAHYLYPDGVAAAFLAAWIGKPFVVTARGSDVNLISQYKVPRRQMQWALRRAHACVAVSEALSAKLLELGAPPSKTRVLRNGIDPQMFWPDPPRSTNISGVFETGPVILSVGNLVENKGHHLVIEALASLRSVYPAAALNIVGSGPCLNALREFAHRKGVESAVRFVGTVDQPALRCLYSGADVLVLASSREGWPNVLLEAMACGTPVVATSVGGIPEIVFGPAAGVLTDEISATAISAGLLNLLKQLPERAATVRHARRFDWGAISGAQVEIFRTAVIAARLPDSAHA